MHANARGGESMWSGEAGDESIENDGWEIDGLVDGLVDGSMDGGDGRRNILGDGG